MVSIQLSYDEALVLSGWLGRSDSQRDSLVIGTAERIALSQLDTALEPLIDEIFDPRWDEHVEAARGRLLRDFPLDG